MDISKAKNIQPLPPPQQQLQLRRRRRRKKVSDTTTTNNTNNNTNDKITCPFCFKILLKRRDVVPIRYIVNLILQLLINVCLLIRKIVLVF